MKVLLKLIIVILPWFLKRHLLTGIYGYKIHPSARIGLAYIYPKYLEMDEKSKIDHFTIAIHLDKIVMHKNTSIGRSNWITGFPKDQKSLHFSHQKDRDASLILGKDSSITKNHHIDCTNKIKIGKFVTIAGYQSQLLTHSINITENRQDSEPIQIGDYCFVGTNVVILGGSTLPSYSVLGAKSLLNKSFSEERTLYAGVPSKPVKQLTGKVKYFNRDIGFVH